MVIKSLDPFIWALQSRLIGSALSSSQGLVQTCLPRYSEKVLHTFDLPCRCIGCNNAGCSISWYNLADGDLYIQNTSDLQWISIKVFELHIGLDQIFRSLLMLSTCGVRHEVDGTMKRTGFPRGQPDSLYQSISHTEYISGSNHNHTIDKQYIHGFNYYIIRGYAVRISEYKPVGLNAKQTESVVITRPQANSIWDLLLHR